MVHENHCDDRDLDGLVLWTNMSISGRVAECIVAIDVTQVRFPADAYVQQIFALFCATRRARRRAEDLCKDRRLVIRRWVNSSVVRAADCRSAGPWLKSGLALYATCAGGHALRRRRILSL